MHHRNPTGVSPASAFTTHGCFLTAMSGSKLYVPSPTRSILLPGLLPPTACLKTTASASTARLRLSNLSAVHSYVPYRGGTGPLLCRKTVQRCGTALVPAFMMICLSCSPGVTTGLLLAPISILARYSLFLLSGILTDYGRRLVDHDLPTGHTARPAPEGNPLLAATELSAGQDIRQS